MGSLLSIPVAYVHAKVDQAKQAVRTGINDTKNYIYTSINNTQVAITTRIVNTRDAITTGIQTRIDNVNTAVYTRVDNTRNACLETVSGIRTSVQRRVDAVTSSVRVVTDGVTNGVSTVVTSVESIGSAVVGSVRSVRSTVSSKVSRTTASITEAYRRTANRRLSWFEKVKYGVLLLLVMLVVIVSGVLLWDVYKGDMDAAKHKLHVMYTAADDASVFLARALSRLSSNFWSFLSCGLQILGSYVFMCIHVALTQLSHAATATQVYSVEGAKIGFKYTVIASQTVGHFMNESAYVSAEYISIGSKVAWEYFLYASDCSWTFAKYASRRGAEIVQVVLVYLVSVSKACVIHLMDASEVTLKFLMRAAKDGGVLAAQWSMDAAIWSAEMLKYAATDGRVKLWANLQVLVYDLFTGSYTVSELLLDTSTFIANNTIRGSVAFFHWSMDTLYTASDWTVQSSKVTADFVAVSTVAVYHTTYNATITTYNAVYVTVVWTYETVCSGSMTTCDFIWSVLSTTFHVVFVTSKFIYIQTDAVVRFTIYWVTAIVTFLWQWLSYIVLTITHILDVTLNRFGVRYLVIICQYITQWTLALGEIVFAFLYEVGTYLGRFCYSTGVHVYNVAYIVCAFLWQLVTCVLSVVKMFVGLLVTCVTGIFQAVLWFVDEFMLAYLYMLHQYNIYREMLFFAFIVIMTLYCSGLIQDRTVTGENSRDDDDEFDGDDVYDDDDDGGGHHQNDNGHNIGNSRESRIADDTQRESHHQGQASIMKVKPLTTLETRPPPAYMQRSVIPAYDEIDDNEDDEDIAIGDHHLTDDSDLDSDFDLDAIPDVMDSTDSETELMPGRIDELTPPEEHHEPPGGAIDDPDELTPPEEDGMPADGAGDVVVVASNTSEDLIDSDVTCRQDPQHAEATEEDEFVNIEELSEFPDIDQSDEEEGKTGSE